MSRAGRKSAFLDTHVVVLLAAGRVGDLGKAGRRLVETATLFISPMVRFELALLRERGRIGVDPDRIVADLARAVGLIEAHDPLSAVVDRALELTWARDPFDRLLVAHALLHDARFVTRDRAIRQHLPTAVW